MVQRYDREEFLETVWPGLYHPGDHVLTLGPTQRAGKTHLNFQLLKHARTANLTPVVFCMKPRDRTVTSWSNSLGYKETAEWPPVKWPWQEEPPGYTLWPKHPYEIDKANEHISGVFKKAMLDQYRKGNSVLFLDEVYGICAELHLQKELIAIATRGGGLGCGAWMASQKPSGTQQGSLPGFVFNCPKHYFLSNDNDKRNRERYSEISGGLDPKIVEGITLGLRRFEFLYVNADGQACIVGP